MEALIVNVNTIIPKCKSKWPKPKQMNCQFLFSKRRPWVFINLFSKYSVLSQIPQKQSLRQGLLKKEKESDEGREEEESQRKHKCGLSGSFSLTPHPTHPPQGA